MSILMCFGAWLCGFISPWSLTVAYSGNYWCPWILIEFECSDCLSFGYGRTIAGCECHVWKFKCNIYCGSFDGPHWKIFNISKFDIDMSCIFMCMSIDVNISCMSLVSTDFYTKCNSFCRVSILLTISYIW